MPDLRELSERIEKAHGPDRGLDGFIARDLLGWLPYFDLEGDRLIEWPDMGGHWHQPGDSCDHHHSIDETRNQEPPEYTASIDAALALVEKVRGDRDWAWQLNHAFDRDGEEHFGFALIDWDGRAGDDDAEEYLATKSNAPLAILAALLRALANHDLPAGTKDPK